MKYALLLFVFISFSPSSLLAQVNCENMGFEMGNFEGWTLSYGAVGVMNEKKNFSRETIGSLNDEHHITHISEGRDPYVPEIPVVAPGSNHSIRIGTNRNGVHFSRIRTNFLVTAEAGIFQYQVAAVLQNPTLANGGNSHIQIAKPGFNVSISEHNGGKLTCGAYDFQPTDDASDDGFKTSGAIQYRNWTKGAIDLRSYYGKMITVEVTVHGCLGGGHFGYIYFDANCLRTENQEILSDCPDAQGYADLVAPAGFGKYVWSNGDSTQIIKVKAKLGEQYSVKMLPDKTLDESCGLQLNHTIKRQQARIAIDTTICDGEEIALGDTIIKTAGTYQKLVSRGGFCDSIAVLKLSVIPSVTLPEITPDTYITKGDSTELRVVPYPAGDYQFLWSNPESLSCPDCATTWARPVEDTEYEVTVTDSEKKCSQKAKVHVYVKSCGLHMPDAFSPDNDQQNDVFFAYGPACIDQIVEMVIYNRQGEVVFRQQNCAASDPKFGWNGAYRGLPVAPGIYPYKIQARTSKGEVLSYRGVVNLLR